mgnify:CR=1 FL=1
MRYLFATLVMMPLLALNAHAADNTQTAILGGGCFWCVESDFDKVEGVISTVSGYTGGSIQNPTYENHKSGTPHVEVVKVTFKPDVISYKDILTHYFTHIDPLDEGGQFCDRGPSYRPVIFAKEGTQMAVAKERKIWAEKVLGKPVAVEIQPTHTFHKAEEYHQNYYKKNPIRYTYYRLSCGRNARVDEVWSDLP